jgi:hypothetical protein
MVQKKRLLTAHWSPEQWDCMTASDEEERVGIGEERVGIGEERVGIGEKICLYCILGILCTYGGR